MRCLSALADIQAGDLLASPLLLRAEFRSGRLEIALFLALWQQSIFHRLVQGGGPQVVSYFESPPFLLR